jgi:hypothetical protein
VPAIKAVLKNPGTATAMKVPKCRDGSFDFVNLYNNFVQNRSERRVGADGDDFRGQGFLLKIDVAGPALQNRWRLETRPDGYAASIRRTQA